MEKHIEYLQITRTNILQSIEGLTIEQLNKVPATHNNNIIWNIGHCLVTQQLLQYRLSGLECHISDKLIDLYKKGSTVTQFIEKEAIDTIKELLLKSIDWLKEDLSKKRFKEYKSYTTSYNATIQSFEEALAFNNIHEGLHYGYILALKKLI